LLIKAKTEELFGKFVNPGKKNKFFIITTPCRLNSPMSVLLA
jgi:hypothetical protein